MAENEKQKPTIRDTINLVSIGFGVGWLAGLSVSPVATILISGLLGVAIAIVGVISISLVYRDDEGKIIRSVGFKAAEKISIGLLAMLVFGIAVGVNVGICMRTHNCLGVEQDGSFVKLQHDLEQLQSLYEGKKNGEKEIGLTKDEIARRILDKYYPKGGAVKESAATDSAKNIVSSQGALATGSIPASVCEQLLPDSTSGKREYIKDHKDDPDFSEFVPLLDKSDEELEQAIRSNCSSSSE